MAILTLNDLRLGLRPRYLTEQRSSESLDEYAVRKLVEYSTNFYKKSSYDIFLSHSFRDAPAILMLTFLLEKLGVSVYVDWIHDPLLDRSKVTSDTARIIRERMSRCKSLLYAISSNSVQSSWVQWELGLGDGQKNGKVAIVPVYQNQEFSPSFFKQEYLGLYPHIEWIDGLFFVIGKQRSSLIPWLTKTNPLQDLVYG